jgi:hypothetical protein
MGKNKIEGPFVALLVDTLDSPAWQALSHGAKDLYVALKRRKSNNSNRAFISHRTAEKEIKSSRRKIREWFAELEHYGFIVLVSPHHLGVDGKGKAAHWRLTECGRTSRTSENGLRDDPTRDFLRWDGVLFDPKPYRGESAWDYEQKNPGDDVVTTLVTTCSPPLVTTCSPPKSQSGDDVVAIQADKGGDDVVPISSLTTTVVSPGLAPPSPPLPPDSSLEEENNVGPNNVFKFDDRIAALEATENRREMP